jgi:high-affinity nickel-transport protein
MSFAAALAFGFLLGLRHSTDADHVVAVTAVASREKNARGALRVGALWGLGHSATLLLAGGILILFGLVIPPKLAQGFELVVAAMLVVLGMANCRSHRHESVAGHSPTEGANEASTQAPRSRPALWRPVLIGVVHGLAGTGALTLLVLTTIPRAELALLYLTVFGLGTVLGMLCLSGALAVPLSLAVRRAAAFEPLLVRFTGLASVAFGLFLAYRIGFVDGFFFPTVLVPALPTG